MRSVLLIFCTMYLVLVIHSNAMILRGNLVTRDNWAFLARFCFLTEKGVFGYNFDLSVNSSVNLLLYYDAPHQWYSVYHSNKTCLQRESVLSEQHGQIVHLSPWNYESGCIGDKKQMLHCSSARQFITNTPRWWFMALSDCSSNIGLNVSYWISFTNARPGTNFWREHLSADEFYILPELIATACVYVILVIASLYIAFQLRLRRLLHITYKLFMASLLCQLLGVLFEMYSYLNLALKGMLVDNASLIGHLLQASSEIMYTVLMLLLACGYTVTKSVLTPLQTRSIICFISITTICQFSLYIYESEIFDPGWVLYIYESPPGYALIALKLIAWIVFVGRCYKTSKKIRNKLHFYASLLSLGSAWFLCHPLTVLSITLLVDKWVRESFVKGCSLWIVFLGHATFLYVTRPAVANTRFPFHIRTCQVVPIGGEGQDHSYEPPSRTGIPLYTISQFPAPIKHQS